MTDELIVLDGFLIEYELKFCLKSFIVLLAFSASVFAQNVSSMDVTLDSENKILHVKQSISFQNTSDTPLQSLVFNDWNNAYSAKDTPLAKRFSDEFVRSYYRAKAEDRGHTDVSSITTDSGVNLEWFRPANHPDLIEVKINPVNPGEYARVNLSYDVKLPNGRFTGYGYDDKGNLLLKDCFLMLARFDGRDFIRYSNTNLDDIANSLMQWQIKLTVPKELKVISDVAISNNSENNNLNIYVFKNELRSDFTIYLQPQSQFLKFSNNVVTVHNSIAGKRVDEIKKAVIVDQVVRFVANKVGSYPNKNITVTEEDYARNPFYGLSQLPSFLNVFTDDFVYELKFLKTYTNNYLHNSLQLDPRKDNWVYDAVQIWLMMDYMNEFHPEVKMTGRLERFKLLKGYNLITEPFNGQYSYFYMLMARKNLDQPVGSPKDKLLKFNEHIAGKYRAGLSLKYLDSYLGNGIVEKSVVEFLNKNRENESTAQGFVNILKSKTDKNIDWFYDKIINTRDIIDFKFDKVTKTNDSVSFTLKNRTDVDVPISVYGIKDKQIVSKQWIDSVKKDSVYTISRNGAEKIAINYENEVPEFNLRNNYRTLKPFGLNKPVKFVFFKDLEDPQYNQLLYVPTLTYNLYDGLTPGLRFYNKTVLDKPFTYDINPAFSSKTQTLSGSGALVFNQYLRDGNLYHVKYYLTGSYFHYAPDATYLKITPSVQFRIRESDFRDNRKQFVTLRQVIVEREKTNYIISGDRENYSVFNARYSNTRTEITNHFNIQTDFQAAAGFGKTSVEMGYRKLFENNRQLDLRLYAGTFLYNKTDGDYFSFALDRPTDYLFDNNYYGRSEQSGLFSQQLILAEGGFKSKLDTPFANQWITTLNAGINVWNWVEIYGDAGFIKNHNADAKFRYDSGVRLNLVTDYFELYFPVYSSNGWEFQKDYSERIRFIVTLDPKILVNLFTRKWF